MATVSVLKRIMDVITEAGHDDCFVGASHDQIFLLPPGTIEEDSDAGQKLVMLGAVYSDGWYIYV